MNLLFVHDHFFYSDSSGKIYSGGGLPSSLWSKYLRVFDKVMVVGRYGGSCDDSDKLVLSSYHDVTFFLTDSISSLGNLKNISKVHSEIRNLVDNSDAVVCRLPSENGLYAASYSRKIRKPCAIEVVGCAWDALWNYGSLPGRIYAPILFQRMKSAVINSDYVLYVTSHFLQNRYPSKPVAITCSASNVDISIFDEKVLEAKLVKMRDLNTRTIVFGQVGHFKTKYKGVHLSLAALGTLKRDHGFANFEFRILGKGDPSLYDALLDQFDLKGHVHFCGTLPSGQPVLDWLDDIDIQLHPSLQEGLPRVVIESMSRGNICIGSKTAGIPELIGLEMCATRNNVNSLKELICNVAMLPYSRLQEICNMNFEKSKQFDSVHIKALQFEFYSSFRNSIK